MVDRVLALGRGRGELRVGGRASRGGSALVAALGLRFQRSRYAHGVDRRSDRVNRRQCPEFRVERVPPAIDVGDPGIVFRDLALQQSDPVAQLGDPGRPSRLASGGADVLCLVLVAATVKRAEDKSSVDVDPWSSLALTKADA